MSYCISMAINSIILYSTCISVKVKRICLQYICYFGLYFGIIVHFTNLWPFSRSLLCLHIEQHEIQMVRYDKKNGVCLHNLHVKGCLCSNSVFTNLPRHFRKCVCSFVNAPIVFAAIRTWAISSTTCFRLCVKRRTSSRSLCIGGSRCRPSKSNSCNVET